MFAMEYTSLYRKYRPDSFEKMIGQEHIVRTLVNQIKQGRIGHAYLFTGTRGTGKTTTAKIFARAVNCMRPVNGSPCGECAACKAFGDVSNLDIIEIDAASNNSVENIRDLREAVKYPPTVCKYKVFIIDEVHMLSASAFNALLKTLEEPPPHVIFILATTEVQKLPPTVLSRCIRFDFRLIPAEKLSRLVAEVYDDMKKGYTKEAVDTIAEYGEGSARDALSIADMCLSYSEGDVTYADVLEVLGANDRESLFKLSEGILSGDSGLALSVVDKIASLGKSIPTLASDAAKYIRNLIIVKNVENPQSVLSVSDTQIAQMKKLASRFDSYRIARAMHIMSSVEGELRYSTQQRVVLEAAIVRASEMRTELNAEGLDSRIYALEKNLESACFPERRDAKEKPEPLKKEDENSFPEPPPLPEAEKKETAFAAAPFRSAPKVKAEPLKREVKDSFPEPPQIPEAEKETPVPVQHFNAIKETEKSETASPAPQHFNAIYGGDKKEKTDLPGRPLRPEGLGTVVSGDVFGEIEIDDEQARGENMKAKLIAYLKGNRATFDFAMAVTDAEISRFEDKIFVISSKETRIIELFSDERKIRVMNECVQNAVGKEYGFKFIPVTVKDFTKELTELFGDALKKI